MLSTRTKTFRDLAIFIAVVLLCLIIPHFLRTKVGDVFAEFTAPIDSVSSQVGDLISYWDMYSEPKRELIEAGRDLARLNASYTNLVSENVFLKDKIERYEDLLNLPSTVRFNSVVARVIRRDISAWWQNIIIRRGSLDSIRVGDAVISKYGVVGRVVETTLNTSVVELVSSPSFRMAAYFEGTKTPVIYNGVQSKAFSSFRGFVSYVPSVYNASYSKPLRLFTSSLAGTFPEGIYIGEVGSLDIDSDAIFKMGAVSLPRELYDLREVVVLVPLSEDRKND